MCTGAPNMGCYLMKKMEPVHREDKWESDKNKVLVIVERDAWYFFKEYYLPMMEIYAYHQPHFFLLGKN